jgi:hypothetical protein
MTGNPDNAMFGNAAFTYSLIEQMNGDAVYCYDNRVGVGSYAIKYLPA